MNHSEFYVRKQEICWVLQKIWVIKNKQQTQGNRVNKGAMNFKTKEENSEKFRNLKTYIKNQNKYYQILGYWNYIFEKTGQALQGMYYFMIQRRRRLGKG